MFQFDDNFLQDLGLGDMPEEQKKEFLQHLYEELELRVGTRLSEGMSDQQLSSFEKLIDGNDEDGALNWLESNRPDYKAVVAEELEKLKQEVGSNKDQILSEPSQPNSAEQLFIVAFYKICAAHLLAAWANKLVYFKEATLATTKHQLFIY